jgi:hypothetical protein
MNKFKDYLLTRAGLAILVAVVSAIIAGPAIAQVVRAASVQAQTILKDFGRLPPHTQRSNRDDLGQGRVHESNSAL